MFASIFSFQYLWLLRGRYLPFHDAVANLNVIARSPMALVIHSSVRWAAAVHREVAGEVRTLLAVISHYSSAI